MKEGGRFLRSLALATLPVLATIGCTERSATNTSSQTATTSEFSSSQGTIASPDFINLYKRFKATSSGYELNNVGMVLIYLGGGDGSSIPAPDMQITYENPATGEKRVDNGSLYIIQLPKGALALSVMIPNCDDMISISAKNSKGDLEPMKIHSVEPSGSHIPVEKLDTNSCISAFAYNAQENSLTQVTDTITQ